MEAGAIERVPLPAPPLAAARPVRNESSAARQRAFEQALKRRGEPAREGDGGTPRSGPTRRPAEPAGDGLPHVDVVV